MTEQAGSSSFQGATLSGRDLARQRRAALATQGRGALMKTSAFSRRSAPQPVASASPEATADCGCGCAGSGACKTASPVESGLTAMVPAVSSAPSGRDLARARREVLARNGKSGLQRVAQAVRLAATMPESDWKSALVQGATGRQLAMQRRMVQAVAGQVAKDSASSLSRPSGRVRVRPTMAEAPAQDVTQTLEGQKVTGLPTQRSAKVTGNEPGTCRQVTGDQYLSADDFAEFCPPSARPQAEPPKVVVTNTPGGRTVTGPLMGTDGRITGNETGLCRGITGTQYLSAQDSTACEQKAPRYPHKVSVMSSRGEQTVTGTAVGRSEQKVTGGELGATRTVTGTQYAKTRASEAGRQPASWREQMLTGDTPGVGGGDITGDERGACEPVTGTAYIGPDNLHASCTISSRWLTRFPERSFEPTAAAPADFSIQTPARQAQTRRQQSITGLPSQAEDRITGPGNKAGGLITGTPEFRHRGGLLTDRSGALKAVMQTATEAAPQPSRLTGEGSQSGVRVSGDAWGLTDRVTGTEGRSSVVRNPSQRGQPQSVGTHARAYRDLQRPEVKASRVTGSSGNTERGATVTLSGGARG